MSERSDRRFTTVREHYENWQQNHPAEYPEEYLGHLYNRVAGLNAPQWAWAVEYVSAVIASAGTPPSSLNRNPRYSNRVNRPSECAIHRQFWGTILGKTNDLTVVDNKLRHFDRKNIAAQADALVAGLFLWRPSATATPKGSSTAFFDTVSGAPY
jgi:hypothetical protein